MKWAKHCKLVADGEQGFPVVQVVWEDAVAVAPSWELSTSNKPRLTTAVGYLVRESKQALTLVSLINTEHIGHGITIPKGCILSRKWIG